jgi:hypothetical protein
MHTRTEYRRLVAAAFGALLSGAYQPSDGERIVQIINDSSLTAVNLYSVEPLGLSGDGVKIQHVYGAMHHHRYYSLRLLIDGLGTYYLLPEEWKPGQSHTFVIDDSDQIRIRAFFCLLIRKVGVRSVFGVQPDRRRFSSLSLPDNAILPSFSLSS